MHRITLVSSLALLAIVGQLKAAVPFFFDGTITNTTNPQKRVSATTEISFNSTSSCVVRVGPPLYGSGKCSILSFNKSSGEIVVVSQGPLITIKWTGRLRGGLLSGTYQMQSPAWPGLPEHGEFQLSYTTKGKPLTLSDVLATDVIKANKQEYRLWLDRDMISVHYTDGRYTGRRIFLSKDWKPLLIIDDNEHGSIYRDPKTHAVLLEWFTDGKSGYYAQTSGTITKYMNRFLQPIGWSSIKLNAQTVFIHQEGDSLELFDNSLRPLGIKSGKTDKGQTYWAKTSDGITEFFNGSFKPLNWYSVEKDGRLYYAHVRGKKITLYDANLHPLKRPRRGGFWSKLGRGMAIGLAGFAQGMQQAQAAQHRGNAGAQGYPQTSPSYQQSTVTMPSNSGFAYSNTTGSGGNSYTTTSQRLGNFTYSNTYGSNGYHASSTTQSLGPFDYTNGSSNSGAFSGISHRIGNFDYSTMTTPTGTWNGTSQRLGNFTYYHFSGPHGETMTGTSQRIGNFIYTNIR